LKEDFLQALETPDVVGAAERFRQEMRRGRDPWEIHLSLFPVVMRVLNPPFMNAHLPKMYSIYRDLTPYLKREEIPALIQLEINEYARRPLREKLDRANPLTSPISFGDIESAIRQQDWEKTTTLMATFYEQKGGEELARRFLLLGSGYVKDSLGHSVSVSAFILLEMMERKDQDPWSVLSTLSYYFCQAKFDTTPSLLKPAEDIGGRTYDHQMMRATSGPGIINLHHSITRYAIERVSRLFTEDEYRHMISSWTALMGNKKEEDRVFQDAGVEPVTDYNQFLEVFSKDDAKSTVAALKGMIPSKEGRQQLGRFLIRGLCDRYQGRYDPHFLTGLGSALWVVEQYWNQATIALNALFQYLDFYFENLKSRGQA